MGTKDHLPTPEETLKKKNKDLKKVTSTAYIGNPPAVTRGIDQVGIVARTTGEVRDTDFPVLFDIDDQTKNYVADTDVLTYNLDLSKQDAHYHRIIIADKDVNDDDILAINVSSINLAINKELQYTIEIIKDPAMVTVPSITFSPPLNGLPASPVPFPDDFDVWYFLISARILPDNTSRFELLNVGTGSGGGNSFPILYPEENIGSIGGPTQNINISGTDGQFKEITLTGNVNLTFSGFPSATVLEEFWILVNQDNTGSRTLSATGSPLKNAGILNSLLDSAPNSQTLFHFVTGDGGTTLHAELVDLVAGGGGFSGNLSDLVIDVNKDWNEKTIINLAGLDLFTTVANSLNNASIVSFISNAGVPRGQIGRSDFFGTAAGITINIPDNSSIVFSVDTVEKVKIDSTAELITFRYSLNMMDNEITNILYIGSTDNNLPGEGFIRMGSDDQLRIRNSSDSDDIALGFGKDLLNNDAFEFIVSSGVRFTVSSFNIDVKGNNIVQTGNITPAPGSQQIGDSGGAYLEIWAKYFRPEPAANTDKHGYTMIAGGRQFISYDSGESLSGFGIYQDGIQEFLFHEPTTNVHELFIGPDPFLSGETYRIQMGENSNSSAKIWFQEGGTDLFIDRQGASTTGSVALSTGGATRFKVNRNEAKFFVDANLNSKDINNVRNITADSSGIATIGQFQPSNGGFDYIMRSRLTWESDFDTYIGMDSDGIDIVSDDGILISAAGAADSFIIASVPPINMIITSGTGLTVTVGSGFPIFTVQDNGIILQEDLFMQNNRIQALLDPISPQDAATKAYVDSQSGGGGGKGTITDVHIGTLDVPNQRRIDTGRDWFGNGNGFDNLGIVLGTTEPTGSNWTFSYTINSGDFPDGLLGWRYLDFGFFSAAQFENVGESAQLSSKWFVNGVQIASNGGNIRDQFAGRTGVKTRNVNTGTTVQLKAWCPTGDGISQTLEAFGVFVFPSYLECIGTSISILWPGDDTIDLIADYPDNVAASSFHTRSIDDYLIGFNDPVTSTGAFVGFYTSDQNKLVFGEYMSLVSEEGASGSYDGTVKQFSVPRANTLANYRTVS